MRIHRIPHTVTMPKERPKAKKIGCNRPSQLIGSWESVLSHTMMSEEHSVVEEEGGHTVVGGRGEGGGEAAGRDKPDGRDGREEVDGMAGARRPKL
jgi:hypothetical protein